MKKKCIETNTAAGNDAAHGIGGNDPAIPQVKGRARTHRSRDTRKDRPEETNPIRGAVTGTTRPPGPDGAEPSADAPDAVSFGNVIGTPPPDDAVFRDIISKAVRGDIKYQELYLKYIDLISEKLIDENEVVYEATFIDDEDKNT